MNMLEAASKFVAIGVAYEANIHVALEQACVVIEDEAKRVIGTYDYGWPELAGSTQADREKRGFPANEPLLRTGEMRDSIEHNVAGKSGFVGSNADIAVYQELGTSRGIPPRSFLAGAAIHKGKEAADAVASELFLKVIKP